jgi:CheY-like chemotaxis protein
MPTATYSAPPRTRIRAAIIEDNPDDIEVLRYSLRDFAHVDIEFYNTIAAALDQLQGFDVILADLCVGDSTGLTTVERLHQAAGQVPIVVLTAIEGPELAQEAIRLGAQDFLNKGTFDGRWLERVMRYAIERKHYERELSQARAELFCCHTKVKDTQQQLIREEKLKSIGRLAEGLAHELMNPLSVIAQGIHFFERQHDNGQAEVLRMMGTAVERAKHLIADLADFAKPSEVVLRPASLVQVVREAVQALVDEKVLDSACVAWRVEQGLPLVRLDAAQIRKLIAMIFLRLRQFDDLGTVSIGLRLEHSLRSRPVTVPLEVQGVVCEIQAGIAAERLHLSHIYDPLVDHQPTGLGLIAAKKIVQAHHASLRIEPRTAGAAVVMTFPVAES